MKTLRPLWGRGQMISPQHFQQQVNQAAWQSECIARLGVMNPWGVIRVEFDAALLKQGTLKASHLYVRFPDGTLIDSDNADALPAVMVLPQEDCRELTVVLALPHENENGGNCLQMEERAERPVRWRLAWREVRNRYGEDSRQIAVLLAQLTLRAADDDNGDYQTVALARLRRDSQNCWSLDEHFIPPLLKVLASHWLYEQTEQLTNQLRARLQRLMAMRRESNARMADFAVADVSLFWLLNALNSAEPVLSHFLRHPQVHPERLYEALASLAGSLLTFSLDHTTADIPPYRHQALTEVFPPLFKLLGVLLEASLPSRVVAIEMTHDDRRKRWHARLHDPRLREEADFYLSVRSALPAAQLLEQFPQQCKAGSPDEVDRVVNGSQPGIPLKAMSHVPAAIPLRLENQYFTLDMTHPAAQAMLAEGSCVFYVPGLLGDPELELYAVLRS
ncbi:type VI secretion system baseplate subunit TssK [Klebsiella aerogenes]|jgi:type VI secretion protein, VC_A0114 family|uniref:type VI secretion system baseplate subunit TssK n=1 Tax=Klebsiella TaxID=570 RepID=UPI00063C2C4C|nr:type VI secretion system baseplate subunit TssK [Klebsiella aerogenes]EIW9476510.1 type VI secretion system baseplate subunit TssK [Klebsiella aerogenes]EIW9496713.1 type VI secretion system baseplate subunit TssK [Klebsiella aerogenes]EKM7512056.1 type VI secretion system baseplate subunit TssK [Klebsiella aerogenes]ELW9548740.1 type VI secretion system baseplate subunit TssK [Klebsiella aerogenes]KLF22147.1 type VI secretion protein [Klebsiella aerogenes]